MTPSLHHLFLMIATAALWMAVGYLLFPHNSPGIAPGLFENKEGDNNRGEA